MLGITDYFNETNYSDRIKRFIKIFDSKDIDYTEIIDKTYYIYWKNGTISKYKGWLPENYFRIIKKNKNKFSL